MLSKLVSVAVFLAAFTNAGDPTSDELKQNLIDLVGLPNPEKECKAGQGDWSVLTTLPTEASKLRYGGVKCSKTVSFYGDDGKCPDTWDGVKAAALASDACAQPPVIYAIPGRGCKCVPAPKDQPAWLPEDSKYLKSRCDPIGTKWGVDVLYYGCPAAAEDMVAHVESNYAVATVTSTSSLFYFTDETKNALASTDFDWNEVPGVIVKEDTLGNDVIWVEPSDSCISELASDEKACWDKTKMAGSFFRADQPVGTSTNTILVAVTSASLVCLLFTCAALAYLHRSKRYAQLEEEVKGQPSNYVI